MAFHSHRRHRSRSSSALEAVHVVRRVAAEILRRPLLLMWLVLLHAEILAHVHAVSHAAHVGIGLSIRSHFVFAQIFVELAAAGSSGVEGASPAVGFFVGWWSLW
jgi:hypothetical protein